MPPFDTSLMPSVSTTNLDFGCTLCGQCCHDLKLPLTVSEAIDWLDDGHQVQVLCEASPRLREPALDDPGAAHRRRRSFAAESGRMNVGVVAILAASFSGPCPNLRPDMHCGIYGRRPLVCRIYPAEINPFLALDPKNKSCPPSAWAAGNPPLSRHGRLIDATTYELIFRWRSTDADDVPAKARLCQTLGLEATALATDGFVVHSPDPHDLLAALRRVQDPALPMPPVRPWRFVSNRRSVCEELHAAGAFVVPPGPSARQGFDFIGLDSQAAA